MPDLGELFRQADETVRGLGQQADDLYHQLPPEVLAVVAVATVIATTAGAAFKGWSNIVYVWRLVFDRDGMKRRRPVTREEVEKLIRDAIGIAERDKLPAAQTAERIQQIESASTSKLPGVQTAVRLLVDNKSDKAFASLIKVAEEFLAAKDIDGAVGELLRAAAFVSVSNPKKAAEAYERVLALKPDSYTAHLGLTYYSLATGSGDAALAHAGQAKACARTDAEAAYARAALAVISLRGGQSDQALVLVRDNVKHFRALGNANPDDEVASRSLGEALQLLGDVHATLGDLANARPAYQQAYDIRNALAGKRLDSGDIQREHYVAALGMASTLAGWGDFATALAYASQAETLSAAVADVNPARDDILREALLCLNEHGRLLKESGDLRAALPRCEKAMTGLRQLAERHADVLQNAVDLKNAYLLLSEMRERAGDLDSALEDARLGIAMAEKLRARAPQDAIILAEEINARRYLAGIEARAGHLDEAVRQCDLALAAAQNRKVDAIARESTIAAICQVRAFVRTQTGDIRGASDDYAQAIALYAALHQSQPDATAVTQQLLYCRIEHAELKAQMGDVDDAGAILNGCLAAADGLVVRHKYAIDAKRSAAWVRYRLGLRMRSGGEANGAVKALRDSRDRYAVLAGAEAADAGDRTMIAWANISLTHALIATGEFAEAELAAAAAHDTASALTIADPLNVNTQTLLASAEETKGYLHGARGQLLDHVHAFERMLKLHADLAKRAGAGGNAQRNLATAHLVLGQALVSVGRVPEALEDHLTTALGMRHRAVESSARWEDKLGLVHAYLALAAAYENPKEAAKGLDYVDAAMRIAEVLAHKHPDIAAVQAQLATVHHKKGDVLLALGRYPEAQAAYQTDLAARRKLLRFDKANADLRDSVAGSEACIAECLYLAADRLGAKPLFDQALRSYREIAALQCNDHWLEWNILWPVFRLAQIAGDKQGQLEAARVLKGLQDRDGREHIGRHFGWLTDMRNQFPELE